MRVDQCLAGRAWNRLLAPCARMHDRLLSDVDEPCAPCAKIFVLYLAIAAVPMFVAGSILCVLVILGQGSKDEPQEVRAHSGPGGIA